MRRRKRNWKERGKRKDKGKRSEKENRKATVNLIKISFFYL